MMELIQTGLMSQQGQMLLTLKEEIYLFQFNPMFA